MHFDAPVGRFTSAAGVQHLLLLAAHLEIRRDNNSWKRCNESECCIWLSASDVVLSRHVD